MSYMLGIIQHCGERALCPVVRPHALQELCSWTSMGHCQVPEPSNPASSLHFLPMVSLIVIPACLQGQPQVSPEELLPSLDG